MRTLVSTHHRHSNHSHTHVYTQTHTSHSTKSTQTISPSYPISATPTPTPGYLMDDVRIMISIPIPYHHQKTLHATIPEESFMTILPCMFYSMSLRIYLKIMCMDSISLLRTCMGMFIKNSSTIH
ncbi:hypothetical protein EON63_16190 [archaeon]|nr:MAG: hypothetical protein EON63_16190 [archaeon]